MDVFDTPDLFTAIPSIASKSHVVRTLTSIGLPSLSL